MINFVPWINILRCLLHLTRAVIPINLSNKIAIILLLTVGIFLHKSGCSLTDPRPKATSKSNAPIVTTSAPLQKTYNSKTEKPIIKQIDGKQALFIPKAYYKIAGRVVSRRHYYGDWLAKISPIDLAIAWGPMASHQYDKFVTYSHSHRYYNYRYSLHGPINMSLISQHTANEHLIPANYNIAKVIKSIKIGEVVELEGQLVNIESRNEKNELMLIISSLTRNDTGAGACEIIYVEKVRIGNQVFN